MGGSWYKKCGEPGDSNFEHIWFEGRQACKLTAESITTTIGRESTTAGAQTSSVTTEPITTAIGRVCSKCGTNTKSGKLSCCAPGGSWFKQCGNSENSEHTWLEGIQACELGTETSSVTTEPIKTATGRVCPKCGNKNNSGKLSCCTPGGSWFKKCGNSENSEHTWLEGIQACSDFDSKSSSGAHRQVVLPHKQNAGKKSSNIRKGSVAPHQTVGYVDARVSGTDSNNKLAKLIAFTSLLTTVLHIQI